MTTAKKANVVIAATDVSDAKVEKVVEILDDKKGKTSSKKAASAKEDKASAPKKPEEGEVIREGYDAGPKK